MPIPEFFCDGFRCTVGPYGVTLTFGVSDPSPDVVTQPPSQEVVRLRMSVEHAKALVMGMRRPLKDYEAALNTPIPLASVVYQRLGLSEADW